MIRLLCFLILLGLISCYDASTQVKSNLIVDKPFNSPNKKTLTQLDSLPYDLTKESSFDIEKLKYVGKIKITKSWEDANGENIIIFSIKEEHLFVYHYAIFENKIKLLRQIHDFEKDCDYDLFIEFVNETIYVTDLDNDNLGEITFAYKKGCISDFSPIELKLIILENGNKYIIRGFTKIESGLYVIKEKKNIDSSFKNAPLSFQEHADEIWNKAVELTKN